MLILHTSDWHLGRSLHKADLTPAYEMWCAHLIDTVRERGVDAVLISGDVYDRAVPPSASVMLFDRTLTELARLTTVIMTAGNHDSPQRLGFGADLMSHGNVHIRTSGSSCGTPVEIRKGDELALVYPIAYLDPDVERYRLSGTEEPLERSHEAVLTAALELVARDIRNRPDEEERTARIVMAHAFVTGGQPSQSERDISVGGVDNIPSGIFRLGEDGPGPLGYVALGHLHSPHSVGLPGDPPMRYSGSPIAFSFDETVPKSSVLLHVEGSTVRTELIPAPVWRGITTFEGTIAELEELGTGNPVEVSVGTPAERRMGNPVEKLANTPAEKWEENLAENPAHTPAEKLVKNPNTESFARVYITDPELPAHMGARVRSVFPHALQIQHKPSRRIEREQRANIRAMDPAEVVRDFMEVAGNRPLTPEEESVLQSVWDAVRSEEE